MSERILTNQEFERAQAETIRKLESIDAALAPDTGADPLAGMRLTDAEMVEVYVNGPMDRSLAQFMRGMSEAQLQKAVAAMVPWAATLAETFIRWDGRKRRDEWGHYKYRCGLCGDRWTTPTMGRFKHNSACPVQRLLELDAAIRPVAAYDAKEAHDAR